MLTSPIDTVHFRVALRDAFTLVEIMIVVVIIGLLAAIAIPAFQRARERSFASRYANDFRQFESAFQRYATEFGQFPQTPAVGVMPAGMAGYLPNSFTGPSPLGGIYVWTGPSSYIVDKNLNQIDSVMQRVDAILDNGNLATGEFVKVSGFGYALHVQ
jgi:prepilin-type N-terminal cleavage/methylation domain-containing protein